MECLLMRVRSAGRARINLMLRWGEGVKQMLTMDDERGRGGVKTPKFG